MTTLGETASNDPPFSFHSCSEEDTERLGQALAAVLEPGTVVALVGNLGAGKTLFVQAVAAALGADRREVASPTFVLIHEYAARLPVWHFDTYRLRDTDEFLELGADELMHSDGVCFIEWADRVAAVLPADHVRVAIEVEGPESRVFRVNGTGPRSRRIVEELRARLGHLRFQI